MRSIAHVLAELRDLRVRLWIENGELRYRVPRGTLVPEQLAQIRARKDEILAFLRESETAPSAPIMPRARRAVATRLSSAQQRLWVLDQLAGPSATYNIPLARRLRGPFDKAAFAAAIATVSRRHDTLRTSVDIENGIPLQRVAASVAVPWRDIDLSHLPEAQRLQRAMALAAEEADLPFDLRTAPLLRVVLLRLADEDHVLVLTLHHFIADGWSMRVLSKELSLSYAAALGGHSPDLPVLPLQYADYAEWEHEAGTSGETAATIAFWIKQLAGASPLLQLFPSRPRPPVQGYRGETLGFRIEGAAAAAFMRIAQEAGVSLFMALFALFLVLVRRYTGRDDLVIGSPVANRDRRELEPLIGFFSNYLVLRVDCAGDPGFCSLLARVRQVALATYAHQAISFDKVVEALNIKRDPSFTPLVQIMFMLHVPGMDQLSLPGVAIAHFDMPVHTAKCDFTLAMEEEAGGFAGTAIYNRDLFSRDEVQRLIGHFVTLLDSVVAQPECPISQLDMLEAEERPVLAAFARGPAVEFDAELRLDRAFADAARKYPERLAVVDATQALRYEELAARSTGLAASLRDCGARPGRIVGVCLDRSVDLIVAILAILRSGAAYLPLDPDHIGERQAAIVKDAGVELLVTSRARRGVFKAMAVAVLCVDEAWPQATQPAADLEPAPATSRDLAYVIYTSGSTGSPRGVAIEHHSVVNLVAALDAGIYKALPHPLQVGLLASVAFDASVQQIFAALIGGHTLHLVDAETRRDPDRLLDWLTQRRIEVVDVTPSLLAPLIGAGLAIRQDLALRHVIVGGEALPFSLAAAFFEGDLRGRCRLSNIYGPTECCVDATILTLEAPPAASGAVLSIGRPLGNLRVHILDPEGHPVPVGVAGEIWLAGPCVGRGYLGLPDLTAQKFGPLRELGETRAYRTGDYGTWTEAGLIEFFGRRDDQVKIRGHRVELGEIDAALAAHPHVSGVATVVHHPPDGAPELASYVALGNAEPTASALRQWLATKLPAYMLPSRILPVAALPLTTSGKIDRRALPPIGPAAAVSDTAFRAPETVQEKILAETWQGVLRLPAVGVDDRFFDLGGDSIKALQIVARLRAARWQIDIRELFEHPTIGELAPRLHASATTPARARTAATDDIPLMPIQRWFLACFDGALTHYNQTILLHPIQPLDAGALAAALRAVVVHHDALRARFVQTADGWRQWIGPPEDIVVAETDLRGAADPAAALAAAATRVQADCDLAVGRLFRAARFRLPDGDRLLLTAHHLIVDGVSWRILLDDLALAYEQAAGGRTIALAASDSFADWASRLVDYASGAVLAERDYWQTCTTANAAACLPVVSPHVAPARLGDSLAASIVLSRAQTAALIGEANAPYRTEINDLLLTALARAVAGIWLPDSPEICVNVMVEGHGRENLFPDIELSRAVGWFTCEYPVCLRLPAAAPLGRQIIEVKEILRGVPRHGIGYGILRYLTPAEIGLGPAPVEPRIGFNYLGSFDANFAGGLFRLANESAGIGRDPDATMRHDIDVVGMVRDGALQFELGYSPARIAPAVMEQLAGAYQAELEGIIAHALTTDDSGPTPSDLDVPGLTVDTLSEFLQTLGP